jgi:predicted dehydrogenase
MASAIGSLPTDMNRTIRVGLLGASAIAPTAIIEPASRRTDVTIQAVAARDPVRATSFASRHGIANVAHDYVALISRDDIDLVYVSLPPSEHASWCVAALETGKAVLCEKPLATSSDELHRMFSAAVVAGRPLWEAFHYRFHPSMRQVLELCRRRAFGELLRMDVRFDALIERTATEIRWQKNLGGGALMDLGCYAVHAARALLRDPLIVQQASADFVDGVDARASAVLRSSEGLPIELSCSMVDAQFDASFTVHGTRGHVSFEGFVAPQWGGRVTLTVDGQLRQLPVEPRPTYDWQLEHVIQCLSGDVITVDKAADSLDNMRLIESIMQHAFNSSVVDYQARLEPSAS